MSGWAVALIGYIILAVGSFLPVGRLLIRPVELKPGGPSFADSPWFSSAGRNALEQNFLRIRGTLGFWKTQAERYRAFHTYSLVWITTSSVALPFLAQGIRSDSWSRWFVTVVAAFAALMLALSRAFRVEGNYKAFRNGESEYYDLYRRLLDRPHLFGQTEAEQLNTYFEQVDTIRRVVRAAETDNFPSVEEIGQHAPLRGAPSMSPQNGEPA